jgi:hypothetical protein
MTGAGVGGSGAGTILLTGKNSQLVLSGGTVDNFTIDFGNDFDTAPATLAADSLTLGKNLNIVSSGPYADLDADGLTNEGSMSATASAGLFDLTGAGFTNDGDLSVSNGDTLMIEASKFVNAYGGTITVGAGSTLIIGLVRDAGIDYTVSWGNEGTITATDATVEFYGEWSSSRTDVTDSTVYLGRGAGLHSITAAELELFGGNGNTITLGASVLNNPRYGAIAVGKGTALGTVTIDGGAITDGTIYDYGGGFSFVNATLNAVTYYGAVDLSASDSHITVSGITLAGTNGVGVGTVNLTGAGSVLDCAGTQVLGNGNATINLGSSSGANGATLEASDLGSPATLSLGAQIVASGLYATILSASSDATIVDDDTISATAAGGTLTIGGSGAFTNNYTLSVTNGDTILIGVGNFTNLSGGILTGGIYEADAGSIMEFTTSGPIVTDDATIILNGAGSGIESGGDYLVSTLTTIGTAGVLKLLGGRNFNTTAVCTDSGALVLGSGTFTAGGLTVAAGGSLSGSGAVAATIADSGLIEASGGTLTLQKAVTGTGGLQIDGGANLTLGSTLAAGGTATFNGANADLAITAVSSFADTIRGLAATDEIDLIKTAATKAVVNGSNQLVVTNYHTVVATFNLTGSAAGLAFTTESDNNGGTFIVAGAAPAPHASLHLFRQYVAAGFGDHAAPLMDRQDHLAMAGPHDFAAGRG